MSNTSLETSYQRWFIADAYDALAGLAFAPVGGLSTLRCAALDHFRVAKGDRVLELGCGSGGVTRHLCERGALVTSVDWSQPMLRKAARRALSARFERSEVTSFAPQPGAFDLVLFSFVLHELDEAGRAQALGVARKAPRAAGTSGHRRPRHSGARRGRARHEQTRARL